MRKCEWTLTNTKTIKIEGPGARTILGRATKCQRLARFLKHKKREPEKKMKITKQTQISPFLAQERGSPKKQTQISAPIRPSRFPKTRAIAELWPGLTCLAATVSSRSGMSGGSVVKRPGGSFESLSPRGHFVECHVRPKADAGTAGALLDSFETVKVVVAEAAH